MAVVGGGLVGCMAAVHLAKKGYRIDLYESRADSRHSPVVAGRSINLALSVRGRRALAEVGLEEVCLEQAIPMRGRMLHDIRGRTRSVPYDRNKNQVCWRSYI